MQESNQQDNQDMNESLEEITTKKTRRRTLVAPWKNVEEFTTVYSWIYGENATQETKQQACRQIIIWKIRRVNFTPAAVLGTLVILEIQLKDEQIQQQNSTSHQSKELQILYASAFTRFFNYMSSIMQTQTQNMKTMYETAMQLNLRSFVVDLRHICAHGQDMPSIGVLRNTSKYCMEWLEDFYWKKQANSMKDVDIRDVRSKDTTSFEQNVWKLFQLYDAALRCCLKEEKINKKTAKWEKLLQAIRAKNVNLTPFEILGVVVKELGLEVKQEKDMMDLSDVFIDAFLQMRFFFNFVAEKLPETDLELSNLIKHTQGLFRMLATYDLIEDLFLNLLAIVENNNEDTPRRKAASFWANRIVFGFIAFRRCKEIYKIEKEENPNDNFDLNSLNFDNTSKRVLQFYSRSGIDAKTTLIFGDSVRRPWVWTFSRDFVEERINFMNEYSYEILKNILQLVDPQLTEFEMKNLCDLLELKLSNETSMECPEIETDGLSNGDKIYTHKDVLDELGVAKLDDEMEECIDDGIKKYGIWSTAPDCQDWHTCPIGSLIWE